MGSKLLKVGKWSGRNELGAILGEVREDLRCTEAWNQSRDNAQERITNGISASDSTGAVFIRQQQLLSFIPPDQVNQIQQLLSEQGDDISGKP